MSESNRVEYKKELSSEVDLEKEVIAFLNYREGGLIFIGIDKNGKTLGVSDFDADMLKIKDRLKHNIQPSCLGLFDVVAEQKDGLDVIKIIVASGSEKPYYKPKYGMAPKGCFIRIGSSSEPMPQRMIDELFAKRTRNSLSKIRANKQDLSFEQLNIYYQGVGKPLNRNFSKNLELVTEEGDFNYVAYLLSDKNSTSIKIAKYDGISREKLLENKEYGLVSLVKAAKQVLDKLEVENTVKASITSKERIDQPFWNDIALREAVINAFVHNDFSNEVPPKFEIFSDRIEITSTGGLPENLSQEEFFEGYSVPRNKELMRVFRDLDLVEQLGSGIPRILAYYGKECFKFTDHFLRMAFPKSISTEMGDGEMGNDRNDFGMISERVRNDFGTAVQHTFDVITKNPEYSAEQIASEVRKSSRTVENHIAKLKEAGIIVRLGPKLGGQWKVNEKQV